MAGLVVIQSCCYCLFFFFFFCFFCFFCFFFFLLLSSLLFLLLLLLSSFSSASSSSSKQLCLTTNPSTVLLAFLLLGHGCSRVDVFGACFCACLGFWGFPRQQGPPRYQAQFFDETRSCLVSVGHFGPPDLKHPNSKHAWYLWALWPTRFKAPKLEPC